jgi:hypothetical protein
MMARAPDVDVRNIPKRHHATRKPPGPKAELKSRVRCGTVLKTSQQSEIPCSATSDMEPKTSSSGQLTARNIDEGLFYATITPQ